MKIIKWIILIVLLVVAGLTAWHFLSPYSKSEPLDAIPEDAVFIGETNNLYEAWDRITQNKAWEYLKHHPMFAKLDKGISAMDTIVRGNSKLSEFIGRRKMFVSVNLLEDGRYDMVYVVDLRRVSKLMELQKLVGDFSTSNIKVTKVSHGLSSYFEFRIKSNGQKVFCYFKNNLFVGSLSRILLEKSLDQTSDEKLSEDANFKKIMDNTGNSGIFRLYVNYSKLDDYLKALLVTMDDNVKAFTNSLRYTGLAFNIDKDGTISCDGITLLNDSVHSSLRAIIKSGTGKATIEDVLPIQFSSATSLCFNKFTDYFDNMQESLSQTPYAYKNYQGEIAQVEKFLKINVRENFLDWIGEEVTIAQLAPMGLGKNNEFAVFLKTTDIDKAKENLEIIEKQIRKRTPVKIETVDYNGYPINYLAVKGFFRIFLGKLFQKLDKPYYTFINDYVVLANHPQTLKAIIDGQQNKTYVNKNEVFSDLYSRFSRKSNALLLVNTPNLLESLKGTLSAGYWQQLNSNRDNIVVFPYLGFQLEEDGDFFRTRFFAKFDGGSRALSDVIDTASMDTTAKANLVLMQEWSANAEKYIPKDLTQSIYKENYPEGQLKVEIEIKDGFRSGSFREYHENGELKIKGEYKADKKNGTWKFYNEQGEMIGKKEYGEGKEKE